MRNLDTEVRGEAFKLEVRSWGSITFNNNINCNNHKSADAVPEVCFSSTRHSSDFDLFNQPENSASQMHHFQDSQAVGQKIFQVIQNNQEPQKLLSKLALTIGTIFPADFCLLVADSSWETCQLTGWWSRDNESLQAAMVFKWLGHESIQKIVTSEASSDIFELQANESQFQELLPWQSILGIICHVQSNLKGLILVGKLPSSQWSDGYQDLLQGIGESVTIAFSQVYLQQQAQARLRYQLLLNELSQEIATLSTIEQIIAMGLTKTVHALEADGGLVLMLKYEDPLFNRHHSQKIPRAKARLAFQLSPQENPSVKVGHSFSLANSALCQQAFQHAPQPLAINHCQDLPSPKTDHHPLELFNLESTKALLIVPIVGNQSMDSKQAMVLGFLILQQEKPRYWQSEELELSKCISNQIGTAIMQKQTLQQVQLLVEERTAQLKRSLEVQAKLYEKTRQHVEQLRHLNQIKDEFLSTIQDELKHPLTKMKMAIAMLKIAPDSEKSQNHLAILETECAKEINLVNDLLTLQKLESHQYTTHPEKLDLKSIISDLTESFPGKWQDKNLTLAVNYSFPSHQKESSESSVTLYTDADSLQRILIELLSNAGKFSAPDSIVNLEVSEQVSLDGEQVILTLTNTGFGLSTEEQAYIFDKFRRGHNVNNGTAQGTGLGLALVKCLVEHLNGTIDFTSHPCAHNDLAANSFILTLPKRLES